MWGISCYTHWKKNSLTEDWLFWIDSHSYRAKEFYLYVIAVKHWTKEMQLRNLMLTLCNTTKNQPMWFQKHDNPNWNREDPGGESVSASHLSSLSVNHWEHTHTIYVLTSTHFLYSLDRKKYTLLSLQAFWNSLNIEKK